MASGNTNDASRSTHDFYDRNNTLHRGLKSRCIQLIALGGVIGTGLFLGVAQTIKLIGPSVLLSYGIAELMAFFIMRQLGEMIVDEPVAGSFSHFAARYWGRAAGFVSGWNYLGRVHPRQHGGALGGRHLHAVLVAVTADLGVSARVLRARQRDQPDEPEVLRQTGILVRHRQGRGHSWHDRVRRLAPALRPRGAAGERDQPLAAWGFFPYGVNGLVMSMAVIMFSFGGLELVGITGAEAEDPSRSIPRATNQVIYPFSFSISAHSACCCRFFPATRSQRAAVRSC